MPGAEQVGPTDIRNATSCQYDPLPESDQHGHRHACLIADWVPPLAVAGCYRLKVTTSQAGVYEFNTKTKERNATPADQKAEYKVNYCANGHFPEEGGGKCR